MSRNALWALRGQVVDAALDLALKGPIRKVELDGKEFGGGNSMYQWDMQVRRADEATCLRLLAAPVAMP